MNQLYNNVLKVFFLMLFTFAFIIQLNAQNQKFPLSRQDSANISIFEQKAEKYRANNFFKEESDCYNKVADIWWEHNYFSAAAKYYNNSLDINKKLANANGIAMINSNLALIYADKGDYKKSLEYFDKTLSIRKARKEKVGIIAAHINMSVVLNNLKRYNESVKHLEKALDLAREMNDPVQMRSCYGMLSETYEKAGNSKKSMYFFELYRDFNELVENKKVKKAVDYAEGQKLKKELAEKENQIKELEILKKNYELYTKGKKLKKSESEKLSLLDTISEKDLKLKYIENEKKLEHVRNQQTLLKNKLLIRNIILITSLFLLILFIVVFFYIQKQKSNKLLKVKNTEISQKNQRIQIQKNNIEELLVKTTEAHESIRKSIDYAAFIQSAMINKTPKLKDYLPDSFILYKPKDVVGGDFYWYAKAGNIIVIAAVDCTGHGVPGAFLTVLGNNLLNQIVTISKITNPSEILSKMHYFITETLNQKNGNNKDGMDIAVCTVDTKENKLSFAGANNPLVLIEDNKMQIIKGNKYGLGGFADMLYNRRIEIVGKAVKRYDTYEFDIKKGTSVYLFSDGYQDQIGGQKVKKIRSSVFYKLLYSHHKLHPEQQKEKLISFFNEWKGENEQIDDVLVIGIKF